MKLNWTMVSIGSRMISVVIGIIQAYIITTLMSYEGLGIQRIVLGVVAMVGVVQNLGISSGSTRVISASKDHKEVSKVFVTSLLVRYAISTPIVILLIFGTQFIASYYNNDQRLILPLIIMGFTLFMQASQATLKSVVQGMHKFAFLFIHQILEALMSLVLVMLFINFYDFDGYFYGFALSVVLSTAVLFIYVGLQLKGNISIPTKLEFKSIFKSIFKISIIVYAIKLIITQWQNLPILILGKVTDLQTTAIYATAMMIAIKVVTISDAVTDVTLPRNTKVYSQDPDKFPAIFNKNNTKATFLILMSAVILILAKTELFMILDMIFSFANKDPLTVKYAKSFEYVDLLVIAFWAYSQLNLLKSGFSVPINRPLQGLYVFIFLIFASYVGYQFFTLIGIGSVYAISYAMAIGGVASYLLYIVVVKMSLNFWPISKIDLIYLVLSICLIGIWYLIGDLYAYSNLWLLGVYLIVSIYFAKLIFNRKND